MVHNTCIKFYERILNGFKVIERTRNCYLQSSKGRNANINIQELWFLHFARHRLVLNMCMKFYEYILNSFKIIERTRFCQETVT